MVHICVECASVFVVCGVYVWFVLVFGEAKYKWTVMLHGCIDGDFFPFRKRAAG